MSLASAGACTRMVEHVGARTRVGFGRELDSETVWDSFASHLDDLVIVGGSPNNKQAAVAATEINAEADDVRASPYVPCGYGFVTATPPGDASYRGASAAATVRQTRLASARNTHDEPTSGSFGVQPPSLGDSSSPKASSNGVLKKRRLCLRDFEVLEQIGVGRSSVYRAVHRRSGVFVALKVYDKGDLDASTLSLLEHERAVHSSVAHPDVVTMYASFEEEDGRVFLVLDYFDGGDVFGLLYGSPDTARRMLPERDIRDRIIRPVASALAHLHDKGIMHRDVKPENLFLKTKDGNSRAKLGDFGFAIDFTRHSPSTLCGTLDYMAPEVLALSRKVMKQHCTEEQSECGPAVDCWAVGILVYECLVGETPFSDAKDVVSKYNAIESGVLRLPRSTGRISLDAVDFILSCLDLNPKTRITAREMLDHPWLREDAQRDVWDTANDMPIASRIASSSSFFFSGS